MFVHKRNFRDRNLSGSSDQKQNKTKQNKIHSKFANDRKTAWYYLSSVTQIYTRDPTTCAIFIPVWGSNWGLFPIIKITVVNNIPACVLSVKTNMSKMLHDARRMWPLMFCVCFCVHDRQKAWDPPQNWAPWLTTSLHGVVKEVMVYICDLRSCMWEVVSSKHFI